MPELLANPILRGFHPDPSICRVGEDFYLTTSTFGYFPGCPIYHSKDLRHWRLIGHALDRPSQLKLQDIPINKGIYAPTLRWIQGRFYLITTLVQGGGNFFVSAGHPSGPWTDPVWIDPVDIDPSLFCDVDGRVYFTRRHGKHIVQAEIDLEKGRLLQHPRKICDFLQAEDCEGPHLYRVGAWYYYLAAEGGTGFGHRIVCGRSDNPWGPFLPCPHNPLVTRAHRPCARFRYTGHGDLVEAQDGTWWMVFLGTRQPAPSGLLCTYMGRETLLARVTWANDWPKVHFEDDDDAPGPSLPAHPWPMPPDRDDFEGRLARMDYLQVRTPAQAHFNLQDRPGHLRLFGLADSLDDEGACPALLGRRLTETETTSTCVLDFLPEREGEEAGLCHYQRESSYASLAVVKRAGQTWLVVKRRFLDFRSEEVRIPWPHRRTLLRIRGDLEHLYFSAAPEGGEPMEVARSLRRPLSVEFSSVYTGCICALLATGNGSACVTPADFDWWET